MTVRGCGESYQEAVADAIITIKDRCGSPLAQVFRLNPELRSDDLVPMRDWVLDETITTVSLGGTQVCVEATFFLYGSDGGIDL